METLTEFAEEFGRLTGLLDQALHFLAAKVRECAEAERLYRAAQARAWIEAPRENEHGRVTAGEREAWVRGQTAELRERRDVAEGLKQGALEAIRSRRQQISYLQTLLNAHQEEAKFARTGPREAA